MELNPSSRPVRTPWWRVLGLACLAALETRAQRLWPTPAPVSTSRSPDAGV